MRSSPNLLTSLIAFPAAYGDGVEGGHGEWADIVRRVDGSGRLRGGGEERLRGRSSIAGGRSHLRDVGLSRHGLCVNAAVAAPVNVKALRNGRLQSGGSFE